jgi:hypothetical protein
MQVFQDMQEPRFTVPTNATRDSPLCGKYRERVGGCIEDVICPRSHMPHRRDFPTSRRSVSHGYHVISTTMAVRLCFNHIPHRFCLRTRDFHKLGMCRGETLHERMRQTLGLHSPRLQIKRHDQHCLARPVRMRLLRKRPAVLR